MIWTSWTLTRYTAKEYRLSRAILPVAQCTKLRKYKYVNICVTVNLFAYNKIDVQQFRVFLFLYKILFSTIKEIDTHNIRQTCLTFTLVCFFVISLLSFCFNINKSWNKGEWNSQNWNSKKEKSVVTRKDNSCFKTMTMRIGIVQALWNALKRSTLDFREFEIFLF